MADLSDRCCVWMTKTREARPTGTASRAHEASGPSRFGEGPLEVCEVSLSSPNASKPHLSTTRRRLASVIRRSAEPIIERTLCRTDCSREEIKGGHESFEFAISTWPR
jgi:hypothetical protein